MSLTEREMREYEQKMDAMKESLKDTVDINYGRYNNEYVGYAYEREVLHKKHREEKAMKKMQDAAEEGSDRLYNKLRGTKIL